MADPPSDFPLKQHLGMTIETAEPGHSVAHVEVTDDLLNPNGVVHGAVLFALADTGMGAATMSILDEGRICASIEVQVRFLRPVSEGELICDTTVIRPGRRVVQLESDIRDRSGRIVSKATGSFAVLEPDPG